MGSTTFSFLPRCLVLFRWLYDNDKSMLFTAFKFGKLAMWYLRRGMRKKAWAQGMGRHTEEEMAQMMEKDLQGLSDFIGECSK